MNSRQANQSTATYSPVLQAALAHIGGREPAVAAFVKDRSAEIVTDNGTYKVDWSDPNGDGTDYFSIYDDGTWVLDVKDPEDGTKRIKREGKASPLHSTAWRGRMLKLDIHGGMAFFATEFFKGLRRKSRDR